MCVCVKRGKRVRQREREKRVYRLCVHASEGQRERERRETGRGKRYEGEASERHEE